MRTLPCFPLLALIMIGCATSYKSVQFPEGKGSVAEDENLSIACHLGDYDRNTRISGKARNNGIKVVKCRVTNRTAVTLQVTPRMDTAALGRDTTRILEDKEVLDRLSFIEAGYWLYAQPFGFAFTFGSQGSGAAFGFKDPLSLILGILIGAGNWHTAHTANKDFRGEVEDHSFRNPSPANRTSRRLLHVKAKADEVPLTFTYMFEGAERKLALTASRP